MTEEQEYAAAWSLCQAGKYSEAVAAFNQYLKKHPRGNLLAEARFTLGRIENNGNNSFAHYQFILDNFPDHQLAPQAAYATAQYYQNVGAPVEARARYQMTYSRYAGTPAGSESLYRIILSLLAVDSVGQSEAYAKAFMEQYPQNFRGASLCRALGDYWRLRNDSAQANGYWRKILELYSASYEAGEAREQLLAYGDEDSADSDAEAPVMAPQIPATRPPTSQKSVIKTLSGPSPKAAVKYYLQIGVYRDQAVLGDWRKKLTRREYSCLVDSSGPKKNKSYRLLVGPYPDKAAAFRSAAAILQDLKVKTIMVQR